MAFSPRDLYEKYAPSVVRVTGRDGHGDIHTGTAFHIGDGWLVTARHVMTDMGGHELHSHHLGSVTGIMAVLLSSDATADVALLQTDFSLDHYMNHVTVVGQRPDLKTDLVPLPAMLTDWIGTELVATSTLLLGFPPIPLSSRTELVASPGHVVAVVDALGSKHPFFVTSSLPRGGFSGGPVLSEFDFLLGVQVQSFVSNDAVQELGFGSAISVEPIWDLLFENRIFPGSNVETAYLLRHAYGLDESDFVLTKDQKRELDTVESREIRPDGDSRDQQSR